jgi:hypothetical protein
VTKHDIIALVARMININNGVETKDDIDHLGQPARQDRRRADPEQASHRHPPRGAGDPRAHVDP